MQYTRKSYRISAPIQITETLKAAFSPQIRHEPQGPILHRFLVPSYRRWSDGLKTEITTQRLLILHMQHETFNRRSPDRSKTRNDGLAHAASANTRAGKPLFSAAQPMRTEKSLKDRSLRTAATSCPVNYTAGAGKGLRRTEQTFDFWLTQEGLPSLSPHRNMEGMKEGRLLRAVAPDAIVCENRMLERRWPRRAAAKRGIQAAQSCRLQGKSGLGERLRE